MRKLWSVGLGLVMVAGTAGAQSVTVGTPNSLTVYPVGFGEIARYQQIFDASSFPDPLTISAVQFYSTLPHPTGDRTNTGTYDFYLSNTSTSVADISTDFDANVTNPETFFGEFIISDANNVDTKTGLSFNGAHPFLYDPSLGNLMLDIRISNTELTGDGDAFLDADNASGLSSTALQNNGSMGQQDAAYQGGAVVRFGDVDTTPEPNSLALLATGLLALIPLARRRSRIN